jgi:hypothetical protein
MAPKGKTKKTQNRNKNDETESPPPKKAKHEGVHSRDPPQAHTMNEWHKLFRVKDYFELIKIKTENELDAYLMR